MNFSGMLWLESKLDAAGEAKLAQIMRCYIGFAKDERDEDGNEDGNEDEDEDMHWSDLVIKGDVMAHWIVQREIYVREEIQALRKSLLLLTDGNRGTKEKEDTESRPNALEKELQQLVVITGTTNSSSEPLKHVLQSYLAEPCKRTGNTLIGTPLIGFVQTVLVGVAVVVVGTVGAARSLEGQIVAVTGVEDTVLVLVDAAFVEKALPSRWSWMMTWGLSQKAFRLNWKIYMNGSCILRISGGWMLGTTS